MSTSEKTIDLLNELPENQLKTIYRFVQFLSSQQTEERPTDIENLDDIFKNIVGVIRICAINKSDIVIIFKNIVGVIPDTGKTLEEYKEERIRERYEAIN